MADFVPKKIIGKFIHISDIPLKKQNKKILVYFLGAEYCPYCAAERWAIVNALKYFGKWEILEEEWSAEKDEKYLNIPTFTFKNSNYQSTKIMFIGKEIADRNFNKFDKELTGEDNDILDMYNPDQIIPFLLIDGQFMQAGTGINPNLLQNLTHVDIYREIEKNNSEVRKAIENETNRIAALICKALNNNDEVCNMNDNIKYMLNSIR